MSGIPEHLHSVTASLVVTPCSDAIELYERAFDAEEIPPRMTGPDGSIGHAEIRIGDSVVMLADEWPEGAVRSPASLGGSTAVLFIYTDDVDALWRRAIDAGATIVYPLEDQFYGDRSGRVEDPFGVTWAIGQRVEEVSTEEMERRMRAFYEL